MHMPDRRGFLKAAGSLSAAGVAPATTAAAWASSPATSQPELRRSHLQALLGERFSVSAAGQSPVSVQLLAVDSLGPGTDQERSFRAVFESAGGFSQNTCQLSHPALGEHLVFLSPNDAQGRRLEAVFHRG